MAKSVFHPEEVIDLSMIDDGEVENKNGNEQIENAYENKNRKRNR